MQSRGVEQHDPARVSYIAQIEKLNTNAVIAEWGSKKDIQLENYSRISGILNEIKYVLSLGNNKTESERKFKRLTELGQELKEAAKTLEAHYKMMAAIIEATQSNPRLNESLRRDFEVEDKQFKEYSENIIPHYLKANIEENIEEENILSQYRIINYHLGYNFDTPQVNEVDGTALSQVHSALEQRMEEEVQEVQRVQRIHRAQNALDPRLVLAQLNKDIAAYRQLCIATQCATNQLLSTLALDKELRQIQKFRREPGQFVRFKCMSRISEQEQSRANIYREIGSIETKIDQFVNSLNGNGHTNQALEEKEAFDHFLSDLYAELNNTQCERLDLLDEWQGCGFPPTKNEDIALVNQDNNLMLAFDKIKKLKDRISAPQELISASEATPSSLQQGLQTLTRLGNLALFARLNQPIQSYEGPGSHQGNGSDNTFSRQYYSKP